MGIEIEPADVVQRAADVGMKAIAAALEQEGASPACIFVSVRADGVPAGEHQCCVAGYGFDDALELLVELLATARSVGKQLGLEILVVPQVVKAGQG